MRNTAVKQLSKSGWTIFRSCVPGVMQSVLMPITEAAHRGSNARKRTWSFDPAPTYVRARARTVRLVGTGIKHARLRVYAPRRPNFDPGKVVIGSVCPRRTLREYATTRREGDEVTRTSSIVDVIRSWLKSRDGRYARSSILLILATIGDCTFFLRDLVFYFGKMRLNRKKKKTNLSCADLIFNVI